MPSHLQPDAPDSHKSREQLIKEIVELRANLKVAEESIEIEHLYHGLFKSMQEAFVLAEIILDEAGKPSDYKLLDINESFGRLTGVSPERAKGITIRELIPNLDFRWIKTCGRVALTGKPEKFEYQSTLPGKWFEGYIFSLGQGKFGHLFSDITNRKQAEEALLKEREIAESERKRLQSVLEVLPVGVFITNADGKFVAVNSASNETWGNAILSDKPADYAKDYVAWWPHTGERVKAHEWGMARALSKGERCIAEEMEIEARDGSRKTIVNYALPIHDETGRITGGVAVNVDITERKRAEKALRELNENLEQQIAERTELAESRAKQLQVLVSELTIAEQRERQRIANMLHDHLQQLLVGARINGEVLSASVSTENKQTAEKVLNLISQSLQTSRTLTAELSPPILQQGSLSALMDWLARWMKETHGMTVEMQTDSSLDPGKEEITIHLFQSVRELLFNAIKHAGVKSARVEMALDGENRLRVAVTDDGPGFDPERIWDKVRAGTGFGLFSIRERLELMGGSLEIKSSPGNGAVFSLIVPVDKRPEKDEECIREIITQFQKAKTGDKIRVLLVDDHTVVRQGLSTMLTLQSDIEIVCEAADGMEAVEKARDFQPDVILMDISMPKMDGIESTRIIHSELPRIRIIGLSMHDKQDQADQMIEAGASAYCTKDGDTKKLLSVIRGGEIDG